MHIDHAGDRGGHVLLLIHGGGVAGWMWKRQVQQFSGRFHVVVPDLPGHGTSSAEDFASIGQTADELAGLLAGLRTGGVKITVVGFSLGAQIAVDLVSRYPGLVDSAVIVSALAVPLALGTAAARAAGWLMPLARRRWFARLQARALAIRDDMFDDYYRTTAAIGGRTMEAVLRGNAAFGIPDGWRRTATPALVVVGQKEKAVMKRSAALLAEAHPSGRLLIVDGAGHGLPLQDPERFRTILAAAAADR
ncbi:hypothetical protein D477_003992 [Arthrobacter crystallopoietes BAB-32]|uniref:AB hydrolase-1 domain-containing protein n=1 Tax=Arthrobacter crystallopoietes BAB-32 TaxID=1246476 RepID=N1V5S6_9MICC|nr:alpha/beta hydrolase [Arthrobacter crystallopoietes]EMY35447.1 hypothetical protein D477_003992 [Arthrobacter crystallopoietes BAB-32]